MAFTHSSYAKLDNDGPSPLLDLSHIDECAAETLVATESLWRQSSGPRKLANGQLAKVSLSRWASFERTLPLVTSSDEVDGFHTLTMALRPTRMEFMIGGRLVFRGCRQSGTIFLTGPKAQTWSGVFLESFDHLRIYIPQSIMAECYESAHGRLPSSEICLLETGDADDGMLQYLARAMCEFGIYNHVLGPCFLDALGLSMASRLLWLYQGARPKAATRNPVQLAKWRLDRVRDYIETHLSEPIYLSELCEVVGLGRVHFAAQFRASTGYPPFAYILRRRVLYAQRLLRDPRQSIVEVALRVGFSSQAHFTEAFRRVTGETPARWRRTIIC